MKRLIFVLVFLLFYSVNAHAVIVNGAATELLAVSNDTYKMINGYYSKEVPRATAIFLQYNIPSPVTPAWAGSLNIKTKAAILYDLLPFYQEMSKQVAYRTTESRMLPYGYTSIDAALMDVTVMFAWTGNVIQPQTTGDSIVRNLMYASEVISLIDSMIAGEVGDSTDTAFNIINKINKIRLKIIEVQPLLNRD